MKITALIFITLLFLFSPAKASEINPVISPECSTEIGTLVDNLVDKTIADLQNDIVKNEEEEINDSKQFNSIVSSNCKNDFFVNNLSNKILYVLFGEPVLTALKIALPISTVTGTTDSDFDDFRDLSIVIDSSFLISTFSLLVASIVTFLVVFMLGKQILRMRNGKIDKTFMFDTMKIITGLSLIFPLDLLHGISPIQFVIVLAIILGTFIATYTWAFSIFVLDFFTIKENIFKEGIAENLTENLESGNVFNNLQISENVEAHLCEIITVEKAFNLSLNNSKTEMDVLGSTLHQCLVSGSIDITNLSKKFPLTPERFLRTQACLLEEEELKDLVGDNKPMCGAYVDNKLENEKSDNFNYQSMKEDPNIDYISNIRNSTKVLKDEYQDYLREIAISIYKGYCYGDSNFQSKSNIQRFSCISQDINYNYDFSVEGNLERFSTTDNHELYNKNIKNEIYDSVENYRKDGINLSSFLSTTIPGNYNFDEFKKNLEYSIGNGWLGTPSVYFTTPMLKLDKYQAFSFFHDALEFQSLYFKPSTSMMSYESSNLHSYFSEITKLLKSAQDDASDEIDPDKDVDETQTKFRAFSVLNILEFKDGIGLKDCYLRTNSNLQDCSYENINPFKNIVSKGRDILSISDDFWIRFYLITTITQPQADDEARDNNLGIYSTINNIFGFLSGLTGSFVVIGAFFGIALPMIPYIVFASMIIAWIIQAFRSLIVSQFLVINYFLPNRGDDIEEGESQVYSLILNAVFTPFFLIMGATVSFILIHISIGMVNVSFSLVAEILNVFDNNIHEQFNLMSIIDNLITYLAYLIILTMMIIKSTTAMYKVPETLREWFGIKIDTNQGMFQQLNQVVRRIVLIQG